MKLFSKTKSKFQTPSIGSNSQIVSQLHSLEIEKDILTKTIARLYQNETDLTKIQKDRLLLKYQHQLGVVITRIEKIEKASKHPDLGPLGDGLITLMDQKLSQLDQRLYELTSKIQVAQVESDVQSKKKSKKSEQIEEETILDSEIDEFDIDEMTEKFRKWMISNRDRFLVDFENPKGKLKQDEKTFHLRFHDDYSFKIVLED